MMLSCLAGLVAFAAVAGVEFAIENDHTNLIYRVGDEATFTVTAMRDGKPLSAGAVDVKLDNFGPCVQLNSRVDLAAGNPFAVRGRLSEPGFLRLTLKCGEMKKTGVSAMNPRKSRRGRRRRRISTHFGRMRG